MGRSAQLMQQQHTKKERKGGGGSLAPDLPSQSTKINTEINKYKFKNGHIFRTTVTKSGEIVV